MGQLRIDLRTMTLIILLILGIGAAEFVREPAKQFSGRESKLLENVRTTPASILGPGDTTAIVEGVVLGRTNNISEVRKQLFRDAGLWHLLAASGQNIALVIGMCIALAVLSGGGRLLGCWIALAAVPAYVLLVGGGASITRAGIMGELGLLAWILGRRKDAWDALLISAALLVWLSPGTHRSLGFQLSYACVIALLLFAAPMTSRLQQQLHLPWTLCAGIGATVLCSLATAPILLWVTGSAPFFAGISNLIAVPVAGVVLLIGLTGIVLQYLVPPSGVPLVWCAGVGAQLLSAVAEVSIRVPLAQLHSWSSLAAAYCVIAVLLVGRRSRWTWWMILGAMSLVAVPQVGALHQQSPENIVRVIFLDIGQGDSIVIAQGDSAVLVDTGPADGKVLQQLHKVGVRKLLGLVLTHDQDDHAGATESILQSMPPQWIARPKGSPGEWEQLRNARKVIDVCDGDSIKVGLAEMKVHSPPCSGEMHSSGTDPANDAAVVMTVACGNRIVLLTADAESNVTGRLSLPLIDVMKIAHHGSRDDGLERLLQSSMPSVAVISVGERNRYGHPAPEVLDALEARGITTYRTDRQGSVEFLCDGTDIWRADR